MRISEINRFFSSKLVKLQTFSLVKEFILTLSNRKNAGADDIRSLPAY
jgi:hypothetical protein